MRSNLVPALACGLWVMFFSTPAFAQFRGAIQGTVTDPDGAMVPGATITLTSNETNISRTTITGEKGVFVVPGLAPGSYRLTVELDGFKKKTLENVYVGGEQTESLIVQLEIGAFSDSVAVSAPAVPLLDTQAPTIGVTLTTREVENLPSLGRDPLQLVRLTPGVFGDGAQSSNGGTTTMPGSNRPSGGEPNSIFFLENAPQVTAGGTRPNSNLIQVDGVSVNSVSWGGSAVLTPNEESIKEVRIIANNYSAENGRASGAQVLIVSKNGTNQFQGSAFLKMHRPDWNAFQQWNGPGSPSPVRRDDNRFNQEGGSFGGPVVRNKMFGFFSYETLRNTTSNSTTTWFETAQYRQLAGPPGSIARRVLSYPGQDPVFAGVVSLTCAQVGLPSTQCRDVSGGLDLGSPLRTPLGTSDPTYGRSSTPFGVGNGFDGVPDAVALATVNPTHNDNSQYSGRLDLQATTQDLIAFSIYRVPTTTTNLNGRARSVNQWTSDHLSQSWTGIWNRALSATLLNEARVGGSGWNFDELASNSGPWGLPVSTLDKFGTITFAGWGLPGPGIFDQGTWTARDTVTLIRGRHAFKIGGDFSRAHFLDTNPGAARPAFVFHNLWDYANDAPYQENGSFDPTTGVPTDNRKNLRFNIAAAFVQDDWKLRPNLTLNFGLRWDYYSPLTEQNGHITNPVPGSGTAVLTGVTLKEGGDLAATSKRNFGPQVGFAWTPGHLLGRDRDGGMVLRGGFGIGYSAQQLSILSSGKANPPFVKGLTLSSSNCCILYAGAADVSSFTGWPSNPSAINAFDPATGLPLGGAAVNLVGFPQSQNTPVTYRYSLDAQYDLGHNWVASLGYQGSQTRSYARQVRLDLSSADRNPRVNQFAWYPNDAAAHYNALLAEIQHRFSTSFSFDFQYRLSRTTDQGSQDFYLDQYPFDLNASNGPADNDVTHSFKLWGVWTPTIFKDSQSWLEKIAGGWSLSGILNAHSGYPWTPTYNTRVDLVYAGSNYRVLRPGQYLGGAGSDSSNATFMQPNGNFPNGALSYFALPAFSPAGIPPQPGVGRNSFRGPRYFDIDLTLGKAFGVPAMPGLGRQAKVNVQLTAYNVFNTLNLMVPNTSASTLISTDGVTSNPQFGQSPSAFAGRIIDVQARFSF